MEQSEFHEKLIQCIESSLFKFISNGEFFQNNYQNRIDVMPLVKNVYNKMDHERLEKLIISNLEEAVAKKIVDKITTEMGTDIKQLMSNATIRDDFRFYMRTEVQRILDKVREEDSVSE